MTRESVLMNQPKKQNALMDESFQLRRRLVGIDASGYKQPHTCSTVTVFVQFSITFDLVTRLTSLLNILKNGRMVRCFCCGCCCSTTFYKTPVVFRKGTQPDDA